jgi:hypothetical protein
MLALGGPVASAAAGPTVTVRVEGERATLLPPTTVKLGDTPVVLKDATCPSNSAAAALDLATGGNWDRSQFTSTIMGESHTFAARDYWAEWVSSRFGGGLCTDLLNEGDELLMLADVSDATFNPTVFPLALSSVPVTVAPGTPFTVTVTQYRTTGTPGTSTAQPAANVTVSNGQVTATTDADGRATLSVPATGPTQLRAVRGSARSVLVGMCITNGADGACGTTAARPPAVVAPGAAPAPAAPAPAAATADRTAPSVRLQAFRNGARYRASGFVPRAIRGVVDESGAGILSVKLSLTRRAGGRCFAFSGRRERFIGQRCGKGLFFKIGDTAAFSYLLPEKLPRGRYVLDVKAVDKAFNADTVRQRGRNRVVFEVG